MISLMDHIQFVLMCIHILTPVQLLAGLGRLGVHSSPGQQTLQQSAFSSLSHVCESRL